MTSAPVGDGGWHKHQLEMVGGIGTSWRWWVESAPVGDGGWHWHQLEMVSGIGKGIRPKNVKASP